MSWAHGRRQAACAVQDAKITTIPVVDDTPCAQKKKNKPLFGVLNSGKPTEQPQFPHPSPSSVFLASRYTPWTTHTNAVRAIGHFTLLRHLFLTAQEHAPAGRPSRQFACRANYATYRTERTLTSDVTEALVLVRVLSMTLAVAQFPSSPRRGRTADHAHLPLLNIFSRATATLQWAQPVRRTLIDTSAAATIASPASLPASPTATLGALSPDCLGPLFRAVTIAGLHDKEILLFVCVSGLESTGHGMDDTQMACDLSCSPRKPAASSSNPRLHGDSAPVAKSSLGLSDGAKKPSPCTVRAWAWAWAWASVGASCMAGHDARPLREAGRPAFAAGNYNADVEQKPGPSFQDLASKTQQQVQSEVTSRFPSIYPKKRLAPDSDWRLGDVLAYLLATARSYTRIFLRCAL
ncbi:hypothetical protein CPLU01_05340 [Colletotrichum plurivorum]|uniref:Uncharacterized protein n=1 Tax=Colletotrichum plurivorum TaxID=2175906 RepID=A0A8H6KLJ1_9PEZI|nr:hypothetical protein CPLU01_05340 [Colletotrichum plurivorum]